MITPNILALVLAGGEGSRLHPLTQHRSKPSVPFGGRYRIVDFVLSNLVNSNNYQGPSPRFFHAEIDNSIISSGSLVKGARIRNSIIRSEVLVEEDVELDECIVMDYSVLRKGVRLKQVIVDRYNTVEAGECIGYDTQADHQRFAVTDSGIVVLARGEGIDSRADDVKFRYL
ncbi:MAG: hypothetical protein JZU64_09555 [Rhodoferax sp.]|jgi:ADP-glucose pyrophosphorylase|nr:hypothetical protein [Rhodoferax sp.]